MLNTIEEVLQELERIIADAVACNNYLCIFGYVYWRTTQRIQQGIQEGVFEDNARMEHFDVTFAKRYIDAYWQYKNCEDPSQSWFTCFDAKSQRLTIMQHLLMGMNAHINLDLGIVAGEYALQVGLENLKADFRKVNELLASLTDEMQARVSQTSPWLVWLDRLGGNKDEAIANLGIKISREYAWHIACQIAQRSPEERIQYIQQTDAEIARFGRIILQPPGKFLKYILLIINWFEEKDVAKIMTDLRREVK